MKHILITTTALTIASLLATTAFADPIHDAVEKGNLIGVQAELDKGVDVNAKREDGSTPLHGAALKGHKEVAELLIDKGADVHAKDKWGSTPLHYAALKGHKEVAELLIDKGADVHAKGDDGKTPIDFATHPDNPNAAAEIADLLRKHGGKTGAELALIPRLEYGKDRWPFGFSFNAKDGMTYVVEVTQDFKQWGELETIEGTGKQVKFIDPRQPLVQFKRNFYRVKVVD